MTVRRFFLLAALAALTAGEAQAQPKVVYNGPDNGAIVTGGVAVTVFNAGTVPSGCDIINTGTVTLYVDLTAVAVAGSATAVPLMPSQAYHCPYPPTGPVSAVASVPQSFVAVRY